MRGFFTSLIDLVYPRFCILCREGLSDPDGRPVCISCEGRLEFVGATACWRCGAWYAGGASSTGDSPAACPECIGKRFLFRRAVAVGKYAGGIRQLVLGLKYHRAKELAPYLGNLLAGRVNETGAAGGIRKIIPVPMGRWKVFWRGYNQAELVAVQTGRRLGLPVEKRVLVKIRRTPPQSQLQKEQRLVNMRGAFAVRDGKDIRGQNILLVDDVLTTGATANECTEALLKAGAREVTVAVIGR